MVGVVAWRKQVGNHAVTPVVIVGKHRRAHSECSEKRKENQPQQHHQNWFAIKHCAKIRTPQSAPQSDANQRQHDSLWLGGQQCLTKKIDCRPAGGGARTHTILRSLDFESSASANSATPAKTNCETTISGAKLKRLQRHREAANFAAVRKFREGQSRRAVLLASGEA